MDYNLYTLNSRDFEHIIQALMQKILGNSSLVFGDGRDGARELTYRGKGKFDNVEYDGYWVIQAKFKSKSDSSDDFDWVKRNYNKEIHKFKDKKRNLEAPQNYIFFTNVTLSGVSKVGGIDRMQAEIAKDKGLIKNIIIVSYDSICRLLDNNRDVATAYSSFLLSGDILGKLFELLSYKEKNITNAIIRFLQREFKDEINAKLVQAGDSNNQIQIEKIFIDLYANSSLRKNKSLFVSNLVNDANFSHRGEHILKKVLIGEAGAGKSTLTQYIVQLYIATFLENSKKGTKITKEFLKKNKQENIIEPCCFRVPFKIVLKDYADWIESSNGSTSTTIISYLTHLIRKYSSCESFVSNDFIDLLSKLSFIFIFDGLDEVPSTSNRNKIIGEINYFIDYELKDTCDAIIIATTRPQGYTDEFDSNKFEHLTLCELEDNQCITYINKLLVQIENSIKEQTTILNKLSTAIRDETTRKLMRTPLQTTIMTLLVRGGGEPAHNKFQLFREYYDTIVKREKQKGMPLIREYERQIREIHYRLAFYLQQSSESSNNPSAYLEFSHFNSFVKDYFINEEQYDECEAHKIAADISKSVTERLVFMTEIQSEKIGFVIRSMQEFFAANFILNKNEDKIIAAEKEMAKNVYWRNTLLFLIGGIHSSGKTSLLERTISLLLNLNGHDLSPIEAQYAPNSILKTGSWLSLDILREDIFSDSRKYSNQLSNMLSNLFNIPQIDTHTELNKLSDTTINEWIIKLYIEKKVYNLTILNNVLPFLKNPHYYASIEKYILDYCSHEKTIALYIINEFIDNYSDTALAKNIFSLCISTYDIQIILDKILNKRNLYQDTINWESIIDKDFITVRQLTQKITEILILYFIKLETRYNFESKKILDLIFNINDLSLKKTDNLSLVGENKESIGGWFSVLYRYIYPEIKKNKVITRLAKLCQSNKLEYLSAYFLFIASPSKESLKSVLAKSLEKGKFYYDSIFANIIWVFSLMNTMLTDCKFDVDLFLQQKWNDNYFKMKSDQIKNYPDYLAYMVAWSFTSEQQYENYKNCYEYIRTNNSEQLAEQYLLMIVGLSDFHKFKGSTISISPEELMLAIKATKTNIFRDFNAYLFYIKYGVAALLKYSEDINFINEVNPNYIISYEDVIRIIRNTNNFKIEENRLNNIITNFKISVMLKKFSNIIYFIPIILNREYIQNTSLFLFPEKDNIKTIQCSSDENLYLFLTYLIFSIDDIDIDYVIQDINNLYNYNPNFIDVIVKYLATLDFRRKWCSEFIVLIINLLRDRDDSNIELNSLCYTYLKKLNESVKTNLAELFI